MVKKALRVFVPLVAAGAVAGAVLAATGPAAGVHTAQPSPIKHVVVIYLENHSFDNLLGFWCNANPTRCPDGGMPASVKLSNGAVVTPTTDPDVVPQVKHDVASQQLALHNSWQDIEGCHAPAYHCISGYQPGQMPNLISLADSFGISDNFFSQHDSPSWGGHIYAVASNLDGFTGDNPPSANAGPGAGWGCDSGKLAYWKAPDSTIHHIPSCIPDPSLTGPGGGPLANGGAFEPTPAKYAPTIMNRLMAAGLSWHIYGASCSQESVSAQGLEECPVANAPRGYQWSICPTFAEFLYANQPCDVPNSQFFTDASTGSLPAFSVVTPGDASLSWHNGFSITAGDNWLGQLVSAVESSPDWPSTAVFITWDDCGCFYDQVPPGHNPNGAQQGPRVPLVVVSPYAKTAYTDTTPATFASILAFTEHTFGLKPLSMNDGQSYDLSGMFSFTLRHLHKKVAMVRRPVPRTDHIHWAQAREGT